MHGWRVLGAVLMLATVGACAGPVVGVVADGSYEALVPTPEQFAADTTGAIPGGFAQLHASGVDRVSLEREGDAVTFALDGETVITRRVVGRFDVVDREGSGPFKAQKEVLALGPEALVLGDLSIPDPVIWPGSFEDSPVITVKPRDAAERGPGVSCGASEPCLLLSRGEDPSGSYENVNNPELNESPVASIEVGTEDIELTLTTGDVVRVARSEASSTQACGIAVSPVWPVPAEVGVPVVDPVLIFTPCPSSPGASVRLVIVDRAGIPVLALALAEADGAWCDASPTCLWFAPI